MAKKIVLVIVEGQSDDTALGLLLDEFFDPQTVKVHVVRGDITTDVGVNDIIARVNTEINKYCERDHILRDSIQEVIHLSDTDGTYVTAKYVLDDPSAQDPIYSETAIYTANKRGIETRNRKKGANMERLAGIKKIGNTPYRIFYMSCNLDHVLYNKLNCTDEEKEDNAFDFLERFNGKLDEFIEYISVSPFAVMTGYRESWKYIRQGLHSLERHTNFGLCFTEETSKAITTETDT